MSKDKAATPADGAAAPKKSKKKLLIIIVAAVLLLGGGAGGYLMFAGGDDAEPPPEPGLVVALDAITINLADGHFLKVSIALQATIEAHEEPEGSKALDILISEFSNRSVAELSSNEAREEAKTRLKEKVSHAYHGEVMDVYFTEFVIQ
jgi:flagellar FliL protein